LKEVVTSQKKGTMVMARARPTVAQRSNAHPSSVERDRARTLRERDEPTRERESAVAVIDLYPG
jgi:hypothetical protein